MAANTPVDPAGPLSRIAALRHARVAPALRTPITGLVVACTALLVSWAAIAQESTPGASPTPAATPAPNAPRLELELQELNDSGISGTVTLYDAGERTIVEFDAEDTGENHPAHIHVGRCDDLTPDVGYPLENVRAGGRSTSVVDVSLDDLLATEFSVDMHLAPDELGTLIACAEIEGEPTVPEGTPAATPGGTPSPTPTSTPEPTATAAPEVTPGDGTGGGAIVTVTPTPTATAPAEIPVPTATVPAEAPVPTATIPAKTPAPEPTPTEAIIPTTTPVSDGTGGAVGGPLPTPTVGAPPPVIPGDGTAGISGKGVPLGAATALPEHAGVGAALAWPANPVAAAAWASGLGAIILAAGAIIIRRGERHHRDTPTRWTRLGI